MFVIADNTKPLYFDATRILIGSDPACQLRVTGPGVADRHALLARGGDAGWSVKNVGGLPLSVGNRSVELNEVVPVAFADRIRIGAHLFHVRAGGEAGVIAEQFDEQIFKLEQKLHRRILNTIKRSSVSLSDKQRSQRILQELETKLAALEAKLAEGGGTNEDFLTPLSTGALKRLLLDRAQNVDKRAKTAYAVVGSVTDITPFEGLVRDVEELIGLAPGQSATEKHERITVLVPWAIQHMPGRFDPSVRRRLALGILREDLVDVIFGLGPLDDIMNQSGVNDIMVLPSGKIYVDRDGMMTDTGRRMLTPAVAMRIVERIVTKVGRRIDQSSPMVDARMADGSRLNAVIDPVAVDGPALTIRRFAAKPFTMQDLVERGTVTRTVANFLQACVAAKRNIIVSGGTGSGKTTTLNALSVFIPPSERVVTIEDTAELQLNQSHVVSLQSKPANLEGKNAVPIRQLVRNALRMRPDRIVVGECRGGEALDMLQAMNTGHAGSLTTIHANESEDALRRLEVLSLEAEGIDLPSRAIREQIASALDLIIQVARHPDGYRRIVSVSEVVEFDEDSGEIIVEDIYLFRMRRKRRAPTLSKLAFTGYVPTFIDDLIETGLVTIESMFGV
jgi:pilus assembly protein CpaF